MGKDTNKTLVKNSLSYPKSGATGGVLIRRVIGLLKSHQIKLPISSHILIACSGGSDSIALAHLLVHYGRRVGAHSQIELLHINHGWRGKESDQDESFVKAQGKKWGVPVTVHRLKPPGSGSVGESLEEAARNARKAVFEKEAHDRSAIVLTAHQAEDVAETLIWRLLTGAAKTHGGGISVQHGVELRPFLTTRKAELQAYLKEEGQKWREDATNRQGRFLRSKMRLKLFPVLEELFPKAVEHLVQLALNAQASSVPGAGSDEWVSPVGALFEATGLRLRRSHWKMLTKLQNDEMSHDSSKEIHLPAGWRLRRDSSTRWVLEK